MQVIFWIMFVTVIAVAIFYFTKYEEEYKRNDMLREKDYRNMKSRMALIKIKDLVDDYKHKRNVFEVMREISDTIIKIELDSDQTN